MPESKVAKAQNAGLDEYVQSMRAYLDKAGNTQPSSPEFRWKDLAANSQQYSNVKLSSISSSKKHYSQ